MAKAVNKKKVQFLGTGRRKKAIARVRLLPGNGSVVVNKRSLDEYFGLDTLKQIVNQPLVLVGATDKYDGYVNVYGGGTSGQDGALRPGLARALCEADASYRGALKKAGFLTRDPRMKERKKYGLKKARKAPQFSKR